MESEEYSGSLRSTRRRLVTTGIGTLLGGMWLGGRMLARAATPAASPAVSPAASPVAGTPSPVGAVFEASMQSLKFIPQEIDIAVGTTVVWTNKDSMAHTVTHRAEKQLFASPLIMPGESFSYTFDKAGTYPYFCMPHPFMTGTVVVS